MAANTNVLQSFLIQLGFNVNTAQYNSFQSKLKAITANFLQYGKVATAAGIAIAGSILETSENMEKLYFSAERAGTSVANLMALRFGGAQAGIGADQMASDVERMASAIRSNPGMIVFFKQLNLPYLKDNAKNFTNLITQLRALDQRGGGVLARMIGSQFGFDEQTLTMLFKNWPDFLRGQKEQADTLRIAGINADTLAQKSHEFQEHWRTLLVHVQVLVALFQAHVMPFLDSAVVYLTGMVDKMIALDHATNGWSTTIAGIAVAFGSIVGAISVIKGAMGLFGLGGAATAATGAAGGAGAAAGGIGLAGGALAVGDIIGAAYVGNKAQKLFRAYFEGSGSAGGTALMSMIEKFEGFSSKVYKDLSGHATIGYGHMIRAGESFSGGITRAAAEALLQKDMQQAMRTVRDLVKVPLTQNQLSALTDFVYNVGGGAFGRSTLLKDLNAGNYSGAAGEFERWSRAGGNLNQGLLNRRLGEKTLFSKPDVNVTQENHITVTGSGDPNGTARAVGGEVKRANGDLIRNFAGAVQ